MLYCIILYYTIPYYTILYYTILYYYYYVVKFNDNLTSAFRMFITDKFLFVSKSPISGKLQFVGIKKNTNSGPSLTILIITDSTTEAFPGTFLKF